VVEAAIREDRGEAGWYRETAPLAPAGVSGFRFVE
jgi:hypothetical protein